MAGWYDAELTAMIATKQRQGQPVNFYALHKGLRERAQSLRLSEAKFLIEEYCERHNLSLPRGHLPLGARILLIVLLAVLFLAGAKLISLLCRM